jgi:hypothetical protein
MTSEVIAAARRGIEIGGRKESLMNLRIEKAQLLRRALQADGLVSALSGFLLLVVPGPIASLLGAGSPGLVAAVGASLVAFGALVARNGWREVPRRGAAGLTVALNVAWVVGSAILIAGGPLSKTGNWAVALVADVVLVLAIVESVGLRRQSAAPDDLAGAAAR